MDTYSPISLNCVDEIGSTSEALKQQADTGAGETALLARRQTAGRGRLGRHWATVEGNLHVSVLLRPSGAVQPGHWSLLAAVALAEVLCPLAPGLRLKWPNDVMLDGGKLAGILLETGADTAPWLVIGFGANLGAAPDGLGRQVSSLGCFAAPEPTAMRLLTALADWRDLLETEGFAPIRAAWLALGPAPGTRLVVGEREGVFAGIGPDGALLLEDAPPVVSGEVA